MPNFSSALAFFRLSLFFYFIRFGAVALGFYPVYHRRKQAGRGLAVIIQKRSGSVCRILPQVIVIKRIIVTVINPFAQHGVS